MPSGNEPISKATTAPKPRLKCEPSRQSKELGPGNPQPTAAEPTWQCRRPQPEPKSRMCGPQVRFCERGPGKPGPLLGGATRAGEAEHVGGGHHGLLRFR